MKMAWHVYQKQIKRFVQYPNVGHAGLTYPILGLVDEVGEFVDKALDNDFCSAELGDTCFYLARVASHIGVEMMPRYSRPLLDDDAASDAAADSILRLIPETAKLAGAMKKVYRGDSGADERLIDVAFNAISEIALCIEKVEDVLGVDVKFMNVEKLDDRLARNVIKGSGDNR